jgi:hypothetical protein
MCGLKRDARSYACHFLHPLNQLQAYTRMNPNLAEVGKPTRWPPGQSGNPGWKTARQPGQPFLKALFAISRWSGLKRVEAVRKVAKKSPEAFVAIAARICPNDVRLTLEQAIPGGMSLEDYSLLREVIAAIREGLPDADQMQPGAVFQHVLSALRDYPNRAQRSLPASAE